MSKSAKQTVLNVILFASMFGLAGYASAEPNTAAGKADPASLKGCAEVNAFAINELIGRGINLGNTLDDVKEREDEWGYILKEEHFQVIKDAGFDSVRLPIRWSSRARSSEPYTIAPSFFERIDWAVNNAQSRNLTTIINFQNYYELYRDPNGQKEKFLGMWKQIAEHYKDYPNTLLFELLNEPRENLKTAEWNALLKEALAVIRESNPNRTVVIGPANFNGLYEIRYLELPEDDHNIIVTIHYYMPYKFTHQGASWVKDSNDWLGTKWTGSVEERQTIAKDFNVAAKWSKKHNRPIYIGEFGTYEKADMESRALWTKCVADAAVERGFSFTYWQLTYNLAVYDRQTKTWVKPILDALIPPKP